MVNDQKSPIMIANAAKYPKFHVRRQACFGDKIFLDPIKSYPILNRLADFRAITCHHQISKQMPKSNPQSCIDACGDFIDLA